MSKYVLDASALLALLNQEKGADSVQALLPDTVVSTVNLAEVVSRLSKTGMPEAAIRETLSYLGLEIEDFDHEQAFKAGFLIKPTQSLGLSLGDRACLALAMVNGCTTVTADQAWKDLEVGVEVKLIR